VAAEQDPGAPPDLAIDGACPLARDPAELRRYRDGGVTACMPTVGGREGAGEALATLARMHRALGSRGDLLLVRGAADARAAQRSGRLGLLFHLQGGDPFGRDVGLVEAFRTLGVRMVQLCYDVAAESVTAARSRPTPGSAPSVSRSGAR
jgi:membrane dipeptidase